MANLSSEALAALAREMQSAYADRSLIPILPSSRDFSPAVFDLDDAYSAEAALVKLRASSGIYVVGLKVGFANRAMWRALKLETLLWANMYSNTVHYATAGTAELAISHLRSPRIEPEIVFKLSRPLPYAPPDDAASVLESVEWLALGFEIIDCLEVSARRFRGGGRVSCRSSGRRSSTCERRIHP